MAVALAPFPIYRAATNNGNPLAGGLVDTFAAGTFTPLATFSDAAGVSPNPNPVVLDASGRANIYFTIGVAYKIRQRDATGVTLWTVDNFLVSPQGDPTLINDYSTTVAQSEETLDPGEVGTEVLAQSLTDEIKELRFVVKEMKGTASWRTSNAIRHMSAGLFTGVAPGTIWTPTGTTSWAWRTFIPDGWQTGSIMALVIMRRQLTAGGGTVKMFWNYVRYRDNAAPLVSGNAQIDITPADTNSHLVTLTLVPASNFQAGDFVGIEITRDGDNAADTNNSSTALDGFWIEYTGIASR